MENNNFIIYIPGLFSTSLKKGNDVVWPISPTDLSIKYIKELAKKPFNAIFKKKPLNEESNLKTVVTKLLTTLQDKNLTIGELNNSNNTNIINLLKLYSNNNLFIFTYDWRQSFDVSTKRFKEEVDKLEINDKTITIVAHSAGGVIAYKYLNENVESYNSESNFYKIKKCISIGSPMQGSVAALTAILGLTQSPYLEPTAIKTLVNSGNFKSFFELMPSNISNLFYNEDKQQLMTEDEMNLLLIEKGIDAQLLLDAYKFRDHFNNLEHNKLDLVNYLYIVGTYDISMCSGFLIRNNTIFTNRDPGAGDGTVLSLEASLGPEKKARTRYVRGKHSYLTECDDTLSLIERELLSKLVHTPVHVYAINKTNVDTKNTKPDKIYFELYYIDKGVHVPVIDFKCDEIHFVRKTIVSDVQSTLEKEKGINLYSIKTNHTYGLLIVRNAYIKYQKADVLDEKEKIDKSGCGSIFAKSLYIDIHKKEIISLL